MKKTKDVSGRELEHFHEIDDLPVYDDLLEELSLIIPDWESHNQICLTTEPGYENDFFRGTGSLEWILEGDKFSPRDEILYDENFTVLCEQFRNTKFEDIYLALRSFYPSIGRIRIMISHGRGALTWHKDKQKRIHYPIKTQEGCLMIIESEVKHMEEGVWYHTDTLKSHTAINASLSSRIHIVGSIN